METYDIHKSLEILLDIAEKNSGILSNDIRLAE